MKLYPRCYYSKRRVQERYPRIVCTGKRVQIFFLDELKLQVDFREDPTWQRTSPTKHDGKADYTTSATDSPREPLPPSC
jgi:hypothetical protein